MPVAVAETYQSHNSIYQTARDFIRDYATSQHSQRPEITAGKLDSRLKLKNCSNALQGFLPKGSRVIGKTTVGVRCNGSKPWSLHVPVSISVYKNVLVAARGLSKGDILTNADIKLRKHNLASLSYGYFEKKSNGLGMALKRRAAAGTVLTPAMLKKPQIISRGQKVAIIAQSGKMKVRMMGKAMSNGSMGDRIKVLNLKSGQKIEGIVRSSSEVKVEI